MFTIWRTGHSINEEVSKALSIGTHFEIKHTELLPMERNLKPAIAYGILRGTGLPGRNTGDTSVFKECDKHNKPWWELDRGYLRPNHFDGYYRISLNGMQAKYQRIDLPDDRVRKLDVKLYPVIKSGKYILVCPPTEPVEQFYGMESGKWLNDTINEIKKYTDRRIKIRDKHDSNAPLEHDLAEAHCVVTFNSSVALQAVIYGIPAIVSEHSVLHGWAANSISCIEQDLLINDRMELLKYISYCQFTLDEFKNNKAFETAVMIQQYGVFDA